MFTSLFSYCFIICAIKFFVNALLRFSSFHFSSFRVQFVLLYAFSHNSKFFLSITSYLFAFLFFILLILPFLLHFVFIVLISCCPFDNQFLEVFSFFEKTTYCCRARRLSVRPSCRLSVRLWK